MDRESQGDDPVEEVLVVVGMFLLRLGVPLAITLAVGYGLRRLDAKWQAEALARWEADDPSQKEIVEALKSVGMERFCRKKEEYDEIRRTLDPDCALLDIPCWVARMRATGRLPEECYNCELFAASLVS
jgi:hypothetical protein